MTRNTERFEGFCGLSGKIVVEVVIFTWNLFDDVEMQSKKWITDIL